jgi:hypothetical protein
MPSHWDLPGVTLVMRQASIVRPGSSDGLDERETHQVYPVPSHWDLPGKAPEVTFRVH